MVIQLSFSCHSVVIQLSFMVIHGHSVVIQLSFSCHSVVIHGHSVVIHGDMVIIREHTIE